MFKKIINKKLLATSLIALTLTSCASVKSDVGEFFGYSDKNYIPISQIQDHIKYTNIKTVKPEVEYQKIVASPKAVLGSNGRTTDPKQIEAFKNYLSGKGSYIVTGDHMKVYPYDKYSVETIQCSLLMVCTITLEKGEWMTGTNKIGADPLWNITLAETGTGKDKIEILTLKPKPIKDSTTSPVGVMTNFVVPTNKRVYRFNLEIKNDGSYEDISFYYPNESIEMLNNTAREQYKNAINEMETSYGLNDDPTKLVMTDKNGAFLVNTDYTIKADKDKPAWTPKTVWDNGQKTIIQMPKNIDQLSLPNIVVIKDTQDQEVITPRYRNGAFILDGIYKKVILFKVANDNETKVQVTITNNNYPS